MGIIEKIEKLQQEKEQLTNEISRLEGVESQIKKEMKDKFGITTIEQASVMIEELESDIRKQEKTFNKALEKYEKEF